jgi:hypothetical protein
MSKALETVKSKTSSIEHELLKSKMGAKLTGMNERCGRTSPHGIYMWHRD